MDATTLAALKGSIQHWRENVEAGTPRDAKIYSDDCPLCWAFAADDCCVGCPVADASGPLCEGSPWVGAKEIYVLWDNGIAHVERFRAAAQAELDFLISLLPEGETA